MARGNRNNQFAKYKHLIIPSSVGGLVAWIFSGGLILGILVFVAVWVGNLIGHPKHIDR